VTFQESFVTCLQKYVDFSGRASRSEYWWFILGVVLIYVIALTISHTLYLLAILGLMLPNLAASVRRMHDIGKSGWWVLLSIIPIVGLIVIYWFVQPSMQGSNEYGEAPAL